MYCCEHSAWTPRRFSVMVNLWRKSAEDEFGHYTRFGVGEKLKMASPESLNAHVVENAPLAGVKQIVSKPKLRNLVRCFRLCVKFLKTLRRVLPAEYLAYVKDLVYLVVTFSEFAKMVVVQIVLLVLALNIIGSTSAKLHSVPQVNPNPEQAYICRTLPETPDQSKWPTGPIPLKAPAPKR
jgi:hypothetical protein